MLFTFIGCPVLKLSMRLHPLAVLLFAVLSTISAFRNSRLFSRVFIPAFCLLLLVLVSSSVFSQTCTTVGATKVTNNNGDWNDAADWTPNGVPGSYNAGTDTYTIPAGLVVEVAHNFNLGSNLIVEGTLLITGKLVVNASKTLTIPAGGLVTCCGTTYCGGSCPSCASSDQLDIGGYSWKGSDGTVSGPASMSSSGLPIELIYFVSENQPGKVNLRWATASELNFHYFSIERSSDGISFSEIGTVDGHGTTRELHKYSFTDTNPLIGRSYYKLTAIDFDGYSESFKMVTVNTKGGKQASVYPNPVDDGQLFVDFNFSSEKEAQAIVTDLTGTQLAQFKLSSTTNVLYLDLKPGTYVIKITSDEFSSVARFMVK